MALGFCEYRTDDARLTIENLKTSLHYGTTALNYAEVKDFNMQMVRFLE